MNSFRENLSILTDINLINEKIQRLAGFLPFIVVLRYLEKNNKLSEEKVKLIGLKSSRVSECIKFLKMQEDSEIKDKRIKFVKKLETEFENYIKLSDFEKCREIIEILYRNYESWQPFCPIRNAEGYYVKF